MGSFRKPLRSAEKRHTTAWRVPSSEAARDAAELQQAGVAGAGDPPPQLGAAGKAPSHARSRSRGAALLEPEPVVLGGLLEEVGRVLEDVALTLPPRRGLGSSSSSSCWSGANGSYSTVAPGIRAARRILDRLESARRRVAVAGAGASGSSCRTGSLAGSTTGGSAGSARERFLQPRGAVGSAAATSSAGGGSSALTASPSNSCSPSASAGASRRALGGRFDGGLGHKCIAVGHVSFCFSALGAGSLARNGAERLLLLALDHLFGRSVLAALYLRDAP